MLNAKCLHLELKLLKPESTIESHHFILKPLWWCKEARLWKLYHCPNTNGPNCIAVHTETDLWLYSLCVLTQRENGRPKKSPVGTAQTWMKCNLQWENVLQVIKVPRITSKTLHQPLLIKKEKKKTFIHLSLWWTGLGRNSLWIIGRLLGKAQSLGSLDPETFLLCYTTQIERVVLLISWAHTHYYTHIFMFWRHSPVHREK